MPDVTGCRVRRARLVGRWLILTASIPVWRLDVLAGRRFYLGDRCQLRCRVSGLSMVRVVGVRRGVRFVGLVIKEVRYA